LKGGGESLAKPIFDYKNLKKGKTGTASPAKTRSRSKSAVRKQKSISPPQANVDPRQQIYEAKFEKYLANKTVKGE
jgi:hypothetical protein